MSRLRWPDSTNSVSDVPGTIHKCPTIARWQIEAGAVGITLAKVGEAEVFADTGVADIRLAYPVPPTAARRLLALMDRTRMSIVVDHPDVAARWSEAMVDAGRQLDVLVKVDVGFHRCGIDPRGPDAVGFVAGVANLPGLCLRGLLSHAGQSYGAASTAEIAGMARDEAAMLTELAAAVRTHGIDIEEVSVGSTPTARFSLDAVGVTELRPGNYVFFDLMQVRLGSASVDDCALTVLTTVVSAPAPDRVILDAGSKTLTSDPLRGPDDTPGYGAVCTDMTATALETTLHVERLSEEHAVVRIGAGGTAPQPGDRVRIVPNHACVVANLTDTLRLTDGDTVVDTLAVAARGKNS